MNKRELIDAISGRLGSKSAATEAVNAVLETIQEAVARGDKVAITGFGVFEKSERAARTGRNPATGASIKVPASSVPKFRPGSGIQGRRQRQEGQEGRLEVQPEEEVVPRPGYLAGLSAGRAACAARSG